MTSNLSALDHEILAKLVNREAVTLSSNLRLRLEMAGVIRDSANGIVVTEKGKRLARQQPAGAATGGPAPADKVQRDARGRRMPLQRKSIF